ncbi:MAG: mechanosensitive ion channel domain-containing protein [Bacteroidota bacterium]
MKQLKIRIKEFTILTLSFFFLFTYGIAQDNNAVQTEEPASQVETIEVNDIPAETEKLQQLVRQYRDLLQPRVKTSEVDSILNITYEDIAHKKEALLTEINNLSQRELKVRTVEWKNYHYELKDYQNSVKTRLEDITGLNEEVTEEINTWQATKENIGESSELTEAIASIDTSLVKLNIIKQNAQNRLDTIFIIQKRLTEVVLIIDEVIAEINRIELELQKEYFAFDNPPIWNLSGIKSVATDTSTAEQATAKQEVSSGISNDLAQLGEFFRKNLKTAILQVIFILLLLALMLFVKKKWEKGAEELTNPLEKEAKTVIANSVAASVTVGLLISAFFYKSVIPIYNEMLILIILAGTVYLLPKLTHKKITISLGIILLVFINQLIEAYIDPRSFLSRLFLFFNATILIYALAEGRKVLNRWPEKFKKIRIFRRYIIPIFVFLLLASVVTNIIGMVNLSRFLTSAVLTSVGLGAVVYLSVKVFTSIIILIFKLRSHLTLRTLTNMVEVIQKRVRPALMLVGIIVWIIFTLMGFELFEYLQSWVNGVLETDWEINENLIISVGGILAFIVIFIVTMLLARFAATIFQDEWLVSVLPRGIAPAISLLARIILITIGFYMGLSAAGINLTNIGIIFGALSVGIGFGLQSIVLNFISGLILAFERPVNLGDTIEIDQEMGVITSIGVRASNIKTYSGSEVIIPNGDLVSKKVVNWTLTNRDRRSRILMKTSSDADPDKVIELFTKIASAHPGVYEEPAPFTHFYGYNQEGNLDFALIYWTSFSDTLNTDSDIALKIYRALKEEGIQAPIPRWKIVGNDEKKS